MKIIGSGMKQKRKIENSDKKNSIAPIMLKRYIPLVLLIVLSIMLRQYLLNFHMKSDNEFSSIIIAAEEQKLLGQRMISDILALNTTAQAGNLKQNKYYLEELKTNLDQWNTGYMNLREDKSQKYKMNYNNTKILNLYGYVDADYENISRIVGEVIAAYTAGNSQVTVENTKIDDFQDNLESFQNGMGSIINQYSEEAQRQFTYFGIAEVILFIIIIALIFFEIFFIFIPAERGHLRNFKEIEEERQFMMKLFRMSRGALFLLDEETLQVLLMSRLAEEYTNTKSGDRTLQFEHMLECIACDEPDMLALIKNNEKNENIDAIICFDDKKERNVTLYSERTNYGSKKCILVGIYDVTEIKQAETILKNQAYRDELTGLHNRFYLDDWIEEEMARSDRYKEAMSVAILDLDNFKVVNDTFGHPVGDEVLKETARVTVNTIRQSDKLVRFGGEEFLLMLPNTRLKGAYIMAEKIREQLEETVHTNAGKVTASMGVAERMQYESFTDLYTRVDEALYKAKENGRNKVICSETPGETAAASIQFKWNHNWESGEEGIDRQHRELLDIANDLFALSFSGSKSGELKQQMEFLILHIADHFEYEEKIQMKVGYPDYLEHVKIHKELLEKAIKLKDANIRGELKASAVFSYMMDDVIIGHILEVDCLLFPYIPKEEKPES